MSLLKKASIITTPTAYAEDYLYSIKPAYALSENLVTRGDFSADGDWVKGAGWTISGGKANGSSTTGDLYQENVVESGKYYKVTYTISNYVSGTVRVELPSNAAAGTERSANGTYTEILLSVGTIVLFDARTSFTGSIDNVIVQEITDADFDFDRNSTGTRVNEDYLIEDVPYNLLRYSENQLGGGVWGTVGATTVTASNIANPTGATENVYLISGLTGSGGNDIRQFPANFNSANQIITFSVWLKGSGNIRQQMSNGVDQSFAQEITLTSHWQRHILSATFNSTSAGSSQFHINLDDSVSGTSATQFYMWGAQLVKGNQPKDYLKTTDRLDIPRIDYTNGEPSILLEPSRTNLIGFSNDFTNAAWNKSNVTITANQAISPEGIQNADKYSGTTLNQNFSIPISVSNDFAYFVYVKYINAPFIRLRVDSISTWFNIETIEVATNGFADASIEDVGNGWRKLTVINSTSGSFSNAYIHPHATDNTTNEQDGGQFFLYGAQLEAGSYATSLIHTSGSTVTRSADAANNAGNSDLISSTEGVLYAEIKALADDATNRRISLSDGTTANRMYISYKNYTNQIRAEVISSSSSVFDATYSAIDITIFSKIALKYKLNDFSLYIDGVEVANDTSGAVPTGLKELAFDDGVGNNDFYGNVKSVMVFKEALTDLELEKLTGYNNHELYMNYYNRLSYLGLVEEYNVESDINNYIL